MAEPETQDIESCPKYLIAPIHLDLAYNRTTRYLVVIPVGIIVHVVV